MDRPAIMGGCHDDLRATAFSFHVKVVAKPGPAGGKAVEFDLQSNLKDPATGLLVFNKSNNGMRKKDYYLVDFDLDDHTTLNLRFNPNPMKALWVAMGDAMSAPPCPATASYCGDIYATSVDDNGNKMTVRNDDPKWQYFTFSLGFVGDPEDSEYRFDPGGSNQDSGSN